IKPRIFEPRIFDKEATGFGPIFEEEPLDTVYAEDSPENKISMNCRARANPPAVFHRWWLNNWEIKLMEQPDEHFSLVGGNLVITNPDKGKHAGKYVCVAKNVYGTVISKEATVKFGYLNQFPTDEREPVHVKEGQGAVLLCSPPSRYPSEVMFRWIYNDFPNFIIPDQRRFVSQTTGNMYIAKVEASDVGNYSCFVSSPTIGKSVFSMPISLIPQIEKEVKGAERGASGCLKKKLLFSRSVFEKVHNYCRRLSFYNGLFTACAPTFIYNPVKKVLLGAENGRVVIECKPRAAPKPKFIWKRGSELLTNSSRMLIWDDGSLEILNVSKSDEGSYTCYAENDHGKSNSTGTLTITEATKITEAPSDTEAVVGDTTILQCSASFDPSLDITFIWTVDSYVINFYTDFEHYELLMGDENSGDLLIKNIQVRHAGHYSCTAQTIVDNATAEADVFVKGLPGPPGGVRVEEIGDTSVKLRWGLGSDHGSPLIQHVVQTLDFYALDPEDWKTASTSPVFLDGSTESATIVDLYPWMQYEFRVHAINEFGAGENSRSSIKIKTWDARPTVAPSDVLGQVGISGELIVTWTPVKPQFFFGKKFGYVVAFKQYEDSEWKWTTVEDPETRRYVYKESMTPDTEIQVKVKTYNNKGEGPSSLISVVDSPRLALLDVYARQVTATEALVWWLPIYQAPPNWVDGYQIRYWRKYDDNEAAASRVLVHRAINQTRLENMRPDSHYLIEVRAFNGAGLGPPSEHCEIVYKYVSFNRKWLYLYWDHIYNYWNESYVEGYKILFRKEGERYGKLYTTGRHYIDFPMPETGDYIIEVRARCEGGDGPISQIRGKPLWVLNLSASPLSCCWHWDG
uniref:Contactin 1b n=1 Tax=Cyprinus carpio TaxID=7962 RepID=A0A8C1JBM3_CYPCA